MSANSAKGYRAEHDIEVMLAGNFSHHVIARPRAGAQLDRGDISGLPAVISIKDHARMELSSWVNDLEGMCRAARVDTGVVWHKRRGKGSPLDWYVTTTGRLFLPMLCAYVHEVTAP